jgi:hypothetical protein
MGNEPLEGLRIKFSNGHTLPILWIHFPKHLFNIQKNSLFFNKRMNRPEADTRFGNSRIRELMGDCEGYCLSSSTVSSWI